MKAVSPTRSTRTLLALSCWHSAGVAMAKIVRTSMRKRRSTELNGFKNGLHGIGSEPGPNFAGYHKRARGVGIGRRAKRCSLLVLKQTKSVKQKRRIHPQT